MFQDTCLCLTIRWKSVITISMRNLVRGTYESEEPPKVDVVSSLNLLVRRRERGNEPRAHLKGKQKGWFTSLRVIPSFIFLPIRNEWLVAVGFPRKAPDLGYLSFSPGDVGAALQAERGGRVKGVPLFPGFEELAHTEHTRTCVHCLRFFFWGGGRGVGGFP